MKWAVVTGTSRGLGLALAQRLRDEGWQVAGLARTALSADDVAVDLAQPAHMSAAFEAALHQHRVEPGQLEGLLVVHNAGTVTPIGPTAALDATAVAQAIHLNLTAGVLLFAAAMARFQTLPIRKVLAQVSSGAAQRAHAGLSVYSAAKAGLEQHMQVLALEQATQPHPFVPVVLDPGAMDTTMQTTLRGAAPSEGVNAAGFVQRRQQGGLAQPGDVARTLAALLQSPHLQPGQRYHVRDGLPY